jgi:hypothetical protein
MGLFSNHDIDASAPSQYSSSHGKALACRPRRARSPSSRAPTPASAATLCTLRLVTQQEATDCLHKNAPAVWARPTLCWIAVLRCTASHAPNTIRSRGNMCQAPGAFPDRGRALHVQWAAHQSNGLHLWIGATSVAMLTSQFFGLGSSLTGPASLLDTETPIGHNDFNLTYVAFRIITDSLSTASSAPMRKRNRPVQTEDTFCRSKGSGGVLRRTE